MESGLSLCMIVRNEERFLGDALASVAGVADEICLVDTGSTDSTVAIAERFGARIAHVPWTNDFSAARNASLALATRTWILVLDADERLLPESRDELIRIKRQRPDGNGRWIWCRNLIDPARGAVGSTNAIVRVFPNEPDIRYRGRLHEFIGREGQPGALHAAYAGVTIVHYGYQASVIREREKAQRNLELSRSEFEASPDEPAAIYNYGMSASLAGDPEVAREQLERVIEMTEHQPRGFRPQAFNILGNLYLESGRFEDALRAADRCIGLVPTFPDIHYVRGRALAGLGRLHEARDAFGASIANGQRSGEHFIVEDEIPAWKAHNEIAGTLVREERFAEARQWLELALRERPAERTIILNRARCCEAMGDLEEALAAFRAAADGFRDEETTIAYLNFVFRHGSAEICARAVDECEDRLGPQYRRAFLISVAAMELREGRRERAAAALRRVAAMDGSAEAAAIVDAIAAQHTLPALVELFEAANAETAGGPA